MKYDEIAEQVSKLVAECERHSDEYGDQAFELIGDYPLYASKSNISYGEAIMIATIFGHIDRQLNGDKLVEEYFSSLPKGQKGTWAGYQEWLARREGGDEKKY